MRVLIFGAGVIGSLYAALLSGAGTDVFVYARGKRLENLREHGLRYKENDTVKTANVTVLSRLDNDDLYDFILLTVKGNQLYAALGELKDNTSPTIVTMVNSAEPYSRWENICGKGRILPAFPGAGGGFDESVLDARLTPRIIQPTTIGKTDGREKTLSALFKSAGIPCRIVDDMHLWQICHLAMVVPIADAYYEAAEPEQAGRDRKLMRKTARRIRLNMRKIGGNGSKLSPAKMNVFRFLPVTLISAGLGIAFRSGFGDRFMYRHSMKAPDEMRELHEQFYNYMEIQDQCADRAKAALK